MAVKATAQETVFDLTDAYSIMLTSESYTFNGNTSGTPAGKTCSTQVVSYLGDTPKKSNISKVTCPTGISVSLKDNNTIAPTVTFTTTATVTEDCEALIAVTVDDVTISKKFSFAVAKTGSKGDKGDTGAAGNGIKSISYYYARSSSQTAPSASSITGTSIPTLDATNKYLWQKEIITYTNNTSQTTVVLLAVYGNTGAKGDKGNDGTSVTIKSQAVTYQASSSGTTIPSGTWSPGIPTVAKGQYLWTRTVITFSNDVTSTSYSVGYMGTNGQNGSNGSNGKDGKGIKSTEVTYQIWANGTNTPTGTWVNTVPDTTADKPYLWTRTIITYTDNTKSTSYSVGSTLKGVNVGGRNLIRYGKGNSKKGFFKNFSVISDDYCEVTINSKKQYSSVLLSDGFVLGCRNYTVGATYIWSYDIMYTEWNFPQGTDRAEFWIGQRYTNAPSGQTSTGQWKKVTSHNLPVVGTSGCKLNEWYHVSAKVVIPEQASSNVGEESCIRLYNSNPDVEAGFTARFKNVKLELGNIATDWTPAPEDVDADISNAQATANSAQTNASTAQQTANDAQSTANDALNKAGSAQASADNAIKSYQDAINKAKDAQISADRATELANGAQQGVSNIEQVVKIDTQGVRIYEKENSKNYVHQRSDGSHFYTNNAENGVLGPDSRMNNLAVNDYFMSASHRMEYGNVLNQDASVFYHIGKLKKVVQ